MRKVCHLFDSTREKLVREQVSYSLFNILQQLPEFSFEDFVEAWDENDKFISTDIYKLNSLRATLLVLHQGNRNEALYEEVTK